MADTQPRKGLPCQVCGHDLDPVLPAQAQYTHPTCDPQLDQGPEPVRSVSRAELAWAAGVDQYLVDAYLDVRGDL